MPNRQWVIIYTSLDEPNIVAGPFENSKLLNSFIGKLGYDMTRITDSYEDATKDNTKYFKISK